MPEIKRVTTYRLEGNDYKSLDDIKTYVENAIGAIIDKADVTLTPKQKLNMLDSIVLYKKDLVQLLDVYIDTDTDTDSLHANDVNILDY